MRPTEGAGDGLHRQIGHVGFIVSRRSARAAAGSQEVCNAPASIYLHEEVVSLRDAAVDAEGGRVGEPLVGTATLRLVVTRGFAPGSVGSGVIPQIFLASGLSRWLGITLLTKGTRTAMSRLERVDFGFRMSDFGSLSGKGLPEIRHPKFEISSLDFHGK